MNTNKLYYSISEVSSLLGESAPTIRYWSNVFADHIDPKRNAKGNRQYRPEDIEVLKRVRYLTRECGLSLDAAGRRLSSARDGEDKSLLLRESLLRIREQLLEIRADL